MGARTFPKHYVSFLLAAAGLSRRPAHSEMRPHMGTGKTRKTQLQKQALMPPTALRPILVNVAAVWARTAPCDPGLRVLPGASRGRTSPWADDDATKSLRRYRRRSSLCRCADSVAASARGRARPPS